MDPRALVTAIRQSNLEEATALLAIGADVNGVCEVEPSAPRPQELPLYVTHPLFEACRARNVDVIHLLLAREDIDVNAGATKLGLTAFADACARGDATVAALLLADPRVDGRRGCSVVAYPVLFPCMTGCLPVLRLSARHGLLDDAVERAAVATAAANGQRDVSKFLYEHYVDARPLSALPPADRVSKVRREFLRFSTGGALEASRLGALASALGTQLSPEEEREALAALNAAQSNRISLESFTVYWLGGTPVAAGGGGGDVGGAAQASGVAPAVVNGTGSVSAL